MIVDFSNPSPNFWVNATAVGKIPLQKHNIIPECADPMDMSIDFLVKKSFVVNS